MSHCGGTTAGKVPDPVPESSGHTLGAAVESGCLEQADAARPVTESMLVLDLVHCRGPGMSRRTGRRGNPASIRLPAEAGAAPA
jgi:hypothetical protein